MLWSRNDVESCDSPEADGVAFETGNHARDGVLPGIGPRSGLVVVAALHAADIAAGAEAATVPRNGHAAYLAVSLALLQELTEQGDQVPAHGVQAVGPV
jgi:hypothetical protein